MEKCFLVWTRIKKALTGRYGFVQIFAVGAATSSVLFLIYQYEDFKRQLNIPTNVLETERCKNYIYLDKNQTTHLYPDNHFFLSLQARQAIKNILPSPLANFVLLFDRKRVNLAENYISPWTLLRNAHSKHKNIRLQAVASIAAYKDWSDEEDEDEKEVKERKLKIIVDKENIEKFDLDAEFRTLAQSIDPVTCIGLARTSNVDLRLFLPPPPLPPIQSEEEIEDFLCELLMKLPKRDVEKCIQYFTSDALSLSDDQHMKRGGLWCFGGNGINYTRDIKPQEEVELLCLQALVKHSEFEEHCEVMVDNGILQLLQRIRALRPLNLSIQENIVRIIANIALYKKFHQSICQSRWTSLLAETSQSSNAPIRIQASRGLANMDRETVEETFEDGVYVLYPRHRSKLKPEADILFIHGIMGGAFYSWRQQEGSVQFEQNKTDCWPEDWLPKDLPGCRMTCVEYDTNISEWMSLCPHETERRTLSYRSQHLLKKFMKAGIGDRPIVWVTHSMGGLIVKQMLTDAAEKREEYGKILKQTKGVIFFSTPHYGSQLANFSWKVRKLLFPSLEVMELSKDSPKLCSLNDNLRQLVYKNNVKVLSFGEMHSTSIGLGAYLTIVPPESADPGFGKFVCADTDHLNVCKPSSRYSNIYQQTVSFIHQCLKPTLTRKYKEERTQHDDEALDDMVFWS